MKSLIDIVLGAVGVIALIVAIWQFYLFTTSAGRAGPEVGGNSTYLWYAIAAAVVACACALGIFLRHVNKEEEIHITQ